MEVNPTDKEIIDRLGKFLGWDNIHRPEDSHPMFNLLVGEHNGRISEAPYFLVDPHATTLVMDKLSEAQIALLLKRLSAFWVRLTLTDWREKFPQNPKLPPAPQRLLALEIYRVIGKTE